MQKKIGEINFTETMKGHQSIPGFYEGKVNKSNDRHLVFYRNDRIITCIFKSKKFKGVGVAKCSPKDTFDLDKGLRIAEMRARQDFCSKVAKQFSEG